MPPVSPCRDPAAPLMSPRDPTAPPVSPRDPTAPSVSPRLDQMVPPVSLSQDPMALLMIRARVPVAPPVSPRWDPTVPPVFLSRDLIVSPVSISRDSMVSPVSLPRDLMAPLVSPARDPVVLLVSPSRGPLSPPVSLLRCPAAPLMFPVCVRVMTIAASASAPVRRATESLFVSTDPVSPGFISMSLSPTPSLPVLSGPSIHCTVCRFSSTGKRASQNPYWPGVTIPIA